MNNINNNNNNNNSKDNNNNNNNNNNMNNEDNKKIELEIDVEVQPDKHDTSKSWMSKYFSEDRLRKITSPSFIKKEMPLGTFFATAGCLAAVGFGTGMLVALRKSGGVRQTIRTAPPGVVGAAVKALLGGTALCAAMTTGLVLVLKSAYNVETVKDFGDMMRGRNKVPSLVLVEAQPSTDKESFEVDINSPEFSDEDRQIHKQNLEALKALKYHSFDSNENDSNKIRVIKEKQQDNNNDKK